MTEELYNLYTRAFVNAKTQEEREFIIACKDKLEGDLNALKTLKNALTIETTPINTKVEDFKDDNGLTIFTKKLYEIKQNQLDFDLRQNLRDWVLKNACPKEYRAFEIVKNKKVDVSLILVSKDVYEYNLWKLNNNLNQNEYDFLKGVLK